MAVVSEMAGQGTAGGALGPDRRELAGTLDQWQTGGVRLEVESLSAVPGRH